MNYSIDCRCGKKLRVGTADAGGTKRCLCGATNAVPSLGELRRNAGQQQYEISIADKLRYMFANGQLPPDKICVVCGADTADILRCSIECERLHVKGNGYWGTMLLTAISPSWIWSTLNREYRNPEVHGQELVVVAPLPLCRGCAGHAPTSEKGIRELLCRVSLYDQLLREYPKADVTVSKL